jgi:ankyrin repeat protein
VKERRAEVAFKEAAHAALETALTTQDVETLRLSTEAAWRSEQDAERLRARAVSTCEEEIARVQRTLQRVQATQSSAELREVGLEVVSTANKDTLCAMAVQAAVQDGVDVNTRAAEAAGEVPRETWLRRAVREGLVKTVRALAAAGAEVDHANDYGCTALFGAAKKGRVEMLRALLEAGADVDHACEQGCTALDGAAQDGHVEATRALLAAGAEVDHATNKGNTAVHQAALRGHVEVIRTLAAAGADLNHANKKGNTPLAIARINNHEAAALALVQAGATE